MGIMQTVRDGQAAFDLLISEGDKARAAAKLAPEEFAAARKAQMDSELAAFRGRVVAEIKAPCAAVGQSFLLALLEPTPLQLVALGGDYAKRWAGARDVAADLVLAAVRAVPADAPVNVVKLAGLAVSRLMGCQGAYSTPKGGKGGEPYKLVSLQTLAYTLAKNTPAYVSALSASDSKGAIAAVVSAVGAKLESAAAVLAVSPSWVLNEGTAARAGSLTVAGLVKSSMVVEADGWEL